MTDNAAPSPAPQGSPTATDGATTPAPGAPAAAPTAGTPAPATTDGQQAPAPPAAIEYQPFQAPEGIKLEGPLLSEFTALAQASGLSQESAQKLVNLIPGLQGQFATAAESALNAQHDQQTATWKQEALADPNIGEAGVNAAHAAVGRFLTPDAKALLEASGLGNHPAMVRSFMAIGTAISEDVPVNQGAPQEPPKTPAENRYNHPDSVAHLKFA